MDGLTKSECRVAAKRAEEYPRGEGMVFIAGMRGMGGNSAHVAADLIREDPSLLAKG